MTVMICGAMPLCGQEVRSSIHDFIPSENLDAKKDFNKKKHSPKQKKITFIVKNKPKKLIYGNPCMIQETHKRGFEYSVQVPGVHGSLGFWSRAWRNTGTRLRLVFTRGPWWKWSLNSKLKDCRKKTGDLVG